MPIQEDPYVAFMGQVFKSYKRCPRFKPRKYFIGYTSLMQYNSV